MAYAGLFNEKIEIFRETKSQNDFGELVSSWTKQFSTMAKVSHMSGSRSVINQEIQYPYEKQFVVRMHVPILDDDRIFYNGKFYFVRSIDPDRTLWQKIIVAEIVNE